MFDILILGAGELRYFCELECAANDAIGPSGLVAAKTFLECDNGRVNLRLVDSVRLFV